MNLLAHTWVARACGHEAPLEVLGAVAPDLATMAGVRLDRQRLGGGLATGVRCHLRTDDAFHGHPAFVAGSAALRRDLLDAGIARGPARAVGHVGWELLLDGTLLGTDTESAFHGALALAGEVTGAVAPADRPRWRAFLDHRRRPRALRYDDPAWVADRLVAILGRRPRLALAAGDGPAVAAALARHAGAVRASGPGVLADTAAAVVSRT